MDTNRISSKSIASGLRGFALLGLALSLAACMEGPAVDLAPKYEPVAFVVPDSWHGNSPFVTAQPSDGEIRSQWWMLFNDPVLNQLESQALAENPDVQAAAERFVQARDTMMKLKSRLLPHLGISFGGSDNRQSDDSLFRGIGESNQDASVTFGGVATWEPDFWSAIRNRTRASMYRAEEMAANFALTRLSLQAEIASDYFELRGYDALNALYRQAIEYYKKSLAIVEEQYRNAIASQLDIARAQFLVTSTEAKALDIEKNREVTEHALAILVNRAPSSFHIEPVDELHMQEFSMPQRIPANLLERRPDIAAMERRMAQANREIGIARAAFFPNVTFRLDGGFEDGGFDLFKLANSYWSYGSSVSLPLFEGGLRRAQLQQSWSVYRETEDRYRATVLNAFREVENGLSQTKLLTAESERQQAAVAAAEKAQSLTMQLYQGGLRACQKISCTS
jgi:NodT family efflux transporter outer membrane factor (OMF) lipoprotein